MIPNFAKEIQMLKKHWYLPKKKKIDFYNLFVKKLINVENLCSLLSYRFVKKAKNAWKTQKMLLKKTIGLCKLILYSLSLYLYKHLKSQSWPSRMLCCSKNVYNPCIIHFLQQQIGKNMDHKACYCFFKIMLNF